MQSADVPALSCPAPGAVEGGAEVPCDVSQVESLGRSRDHSAAVFSKVLLQVYKTKLRQRPI